MKIHLREKGCSAPFVTAIPLTVGPEENQFGLVSKRLTESPIESPRNLEIAHTFERLFCPPPRNQLFPCEPMRLQRAVVHKTVLSEFHDVNDIVDRIPEHDLRLWIG